MSIFANAKTMPSKQPSKAKKVEETISTPGLHDLVALKAVKTNIEAAIAIAETIVKDQMSDRFVAEACRLGAIPANYKGEDHGTTGSLQLKRRSSASALTDEEQAILTEYEIPFGKAVSQPETFVINPEYADLSNPKNADMLAKVEQVLSALNLPSDFIMRQEEVAKVIATDETFETICAMKTPDKNGKLVGDVNLVETLLPIATTLAVGPAKFNKDADPFAVVEAFMSKIKKEEETEKA